MEQSHYNACSLKQYCKKRIISTILSFILLMINILLIHVTYLEGVHVALYTY